ncbi:hypothetical protein [Flagellimonas baculiformis]|uniref:hypothetical protein n=1 Tax=Flagellimonas baculiformis TaxID=3067310 RepID=UPI00296E6CB5|nr:hypothetical protein [Muricauda sp. D6]
MKQMKNLLPVMLLVLVVWGCDKQSLEETPILSKANEESTEPSKNRPVPFGDLSNDILSEIDEMDNYFRSDGNKAKDGSFGEVVRDIAILDNNEDQGKSYTLRMEKLEKGFYFDNLVVQQGSDGERNVHVVRYTPDKDWYEETKGQNGRFESYSGNISVFREDGTWLADMGLVQGKIAKSTTDMSTAQCILQTSYTMGCVYSCWVDSITIDVYCPGNAGGSGGGGVQNPQVPENPQPITNVRQGGGGSGSSNSNNSAGNNNSIKTSPFDEFIRDYYAGLDEDFEDIIDDTKLKPCLKNILKDLKTLNKGVGHIVQKFAGNTPGFNWQVKDGSLTGSTGQTSSRYDRATGTVTTTFDSQNWKQATDLSWARTILHESVHAYIVSYIKTDPINAQLTFADLFNDFNKKKYSNLNDTQHAEIARNFVKDISVSLREYGMMNGYSLPNQFYEDMAWAGLTDWSKRDSMGNIIKDSHGKPIYEETPWFKATVPSNTDRKRIKNTFTIELRGSDSYGNKKPQKGSNAGC